jgi:hypothetical protein
MGRGTGTHTRERDFEDITPPALQRVGGGAVLRLPDGRYAVRGELVHMLRYGEMAEGTVIVDPMMVYEAVKQEHANE